MKINRDLVKQFLWQELRYCFDAFVTLMLLWGFISLAYLIVWLFKHA